MLEIRLNSKFTGLREKWRKRTDGGKRCDAEGGERRTEEKKMRERNRECKIEDGKVKTRGKQRKRGREKKSAPATFGSFRISSRGAI